jgi:hypothetical protein
MIESNNLNTEITNNRLNANLQKKSVTGQMNIGFKYDQHAINKILPPLSESEKSHLRESIKITGQQLPIMIFEGVIFDGWHRYICCLELGHTPKFEHFNGNLEDAIQKLINTNSNRFSTKERKFALVYKLSTSIPQLSDHFDKIRSNARQNKATGKILHDGSSHIDMAKIYAVTAGVSKTTVTSVLRAVNKYPECLDEIINGKSNSRKILAQIEPEVNDC